MAKTALLIDVAEIFHSLQGRNSSCPLGEGGYLLYPKLALAEDSSIIDQRKKGDSDSTNLRILNLTQSSEALRPACRGQSEAGAVETEGCTSQYQPRHAAQACTPARVGRTLTRARRKVLSWDLMKAGALSPYSRGGRGPRRAQKNCTFKYFLFCPESRHREQTGYGSCS